MVHVRLLWLLGLTSVLLAGTEARCSSDYDIECLKGSHCISLTSVCDSSKHCSDGSDEDPYVCTSWTRSSSQCGSGRIHCSSPTTPRYHGYSSFGTSYVDTTKDCVRIAEACSRSSCSPSLSSRMCEMVRAGKLYVPKKPPQGMNMTSEVMVVLTSAVNSSLKTEERDCPMLYTLVGQRCLALFFPAKVSWSEARQFCRAIYGDLVKFDNLSEFGHLVVYLRDSRLTTDFWVGGRFDLDTNAWSWAVDDSVMPLGTPYWAVRESSSCVARPPPHTDPFSGPSAALPDAPCFTNTQAPAKRQEGWCSAVTYEHYYYLSDQSCQEERSPLCMLEAQGDSHHLDGEPDEQ